MDKLRINRSKVMELSISTNVFSMMMVGSIITKFKYFLVSLPTKMNAPVQWFHCKRKKMGFFIVEIAQNAYQMEKE